MGGVCYNRSMENQDYLNQIAATSAPVKSRKGGGSKISNIIHSKYFLIGAIGFGVLILIMIIGSLLTPKKVDVESEIVKYKLHVDNTLSLINEYQPSVKSSKLRSYSASFQSVLSRANGDMEEYLKTKYDYKKSKADKDLIDEAQTQKDALNEELFQAKINGVLDRIFAHKMAYEVSRFRNEGESLWKVVKDETFRAILKQFDTSLEQLYSEFNDFSETK